ncbi:proline-rich protein PRCC [Iris pallida]|uniref:Proline-rich protein PRCC n=1 Tax=Iris pallida TaxID=29817 RepID=A0AAX6FP96_IRIPA|nr:proline-rich protein PRCC [Iris pallida]
MLPTPKNSLCLAPKKTHVPNPERVETKQERTDLDQERSKIEDYGGSHDGRDWTAQSDTHLSDTGSIEEDSQERSDFEGYGSRYDANWVAQSDETHSQFGDHGVYPVEVYGNYGGTSYESGVGGYVGSWNGGSTAATAAPYVPELGRIAGKRGRTVAQSGYRTSEAG